MSNPANKTPPQRRPAAAGAAPAAAGSPAMATGARRPPAPTGTPARKSLAPPAPGASRVGGSAPPARRGAGGATNGALQKPKPPFVRKGTKAEGGEATKLSEDMRRQAVLAHGRSASVGETEFVPDEEEAGADRYSVGTDGTVQTQGDFLVGSKLKRQSSKMGSGEISF